MIGISKERLLELFDPMNDNDAILAYDIRLIIETECKELDPWQPISENTPKDRYILIFDSVAKSKVVAKSLTLR